MQTTIKVLTVGSLTGLLFAVGLRLTWVEIRQALRQRGLAWVVIANFVAVPALAVLAVRAFALPREIAVAMLLLAAAPFAPVVPIFTKLSRGNLALAAGLTAVFPFLSALLTPLACVISFKAIPGSGYVEFSPGTILMVLFCTITLPLTFGAAVNHWLPAWRGVLLRPVEMISECAGAASLALVTVAELPSILGVGGRALLAMALLCEAWMVLGWMLGGNGPGSRAVIAFGTSNRNIALALLVALDRFPGTAVVPAVVANGLLLILLGLLHVAAWRLAALRRNR